ncbi:MAG: ABC transporter substrate-binding protein, partial [Sulfurimonas sp.]|nr:ABC transporter substrate-binding protein [Sulfurimonas sp.]MDD3835386.1 ABC transporter substrate-binding protein [Sulfurimonas sp.]
FDGAWLCFYNFEGVEARELGFENLFIDQFESPYPNFSALEFMSTEGILEQKGEAICEFLRVTNEMSSYVKANPLEAKTIYYDYTKQEQTKLMDEIISETLSRLETDIVSDSKRWRDLYEFLEELELVKLRDDEYARIWQAKGH